MALYFIELCFVFRINDEKEQRQMYWYLLPICPPKHFFIPFYIHHFTYPLCQIVQRIEIHICSDSPALFHIVYIVFELVS